MLARTPRIDLIESAPTTRDALDDWLYDQTAGVVQSGPFDGMRLLRETSWKEARLAPMLLGCYEEELHGVIEQQIARLKKWERAPNVVVVGCAEGYYAVGLKRRLPKANVYALDTDDRALDIMALAARENEVELIVGAALDVVFAAPDLIVMDCEGAEVAYLDVDKFPSLVGAHIIVEIHNFAEENGHPEQKTDDILLERFRGTHRIDLLMEGPRNPNKHKQICNMSSDGRWMAVNEGRPCLMGWYSMTPRGMCVR